MVPSVQELIACGRIRVQPSGLPKSGDAARISACATMGSLLDSEDHVVFVHIFGAEF